MFETWGGFTYGRTNSLHGRTNYPLCAISLLRTNGEKRSLILLHLHITHGDSAKALANAVTAVRWRSVKNPAFWIMILESGIEDGSALLRSFMEAAHLDHGMRAGERWDCEG
eukprot:1189391-Prorocentrum_minimum.AAC.1